MKCIIEGAIGHRLHLIYRCGLFVKTSQESTFQCVQVNICKAILNSEAKLGKRGQIGT